MGVTTKIIAYCRPHHGRPDVDWLAEHARREGLPVESWLDGGKLAWRDVHRLAQEIAGGGHELLVTHDHKSDVIGYLATRRAPVPWLAVAHGYDFSLWRNRLYRLIDLRLLRRAARVIAVPQSLGEELAAAGVPGHLLAIVRNGIDVEAFCAEAEERGGQWRSRVGQVRGPLVVSVGRLDRQTGFEYLIRAASTVARTLPAACFWIVRDGPLRPRLEHQVRQLGLDRAMRLLGHQRDIAGIMAAADLVVLSSLWEPLGNVLLEALSVGRPVVATRVGGVPEIVREGETGHLVAAGDSDGLARAIVAVLGDPGGAARLGERGRRHVARQFCIHDIAAQLAALYRETLAPARQA
jgi:glycosyltransferase involved in cell wall biosynthesis